MAHNPKCYCRFCGQAILWMKTIKDKPMPVDYDPRIELEYRYDPMVMSGHFKTCKKYKQHKQGE